MQPLNLSASPKHGWQYWWRQKRKAALLQAKKEKDWETIKQIMHKIWVWNKRWVDAADFLIVHCGPQDVMGGSIREMQEAYEYKKPIFLVTQGSGLEEYNSHLLYMVVSRGTVFKNFDDLYAHLKKAIAEDPHFAKNQNDLYQISQKAFIVNNKNQLFVAKSVAAERYDIPGGRVDVHEYTNTLVDSLKREVREELGDEARLAFGDHPVCVERDYLWDKQLREWHYRRVFYVLYEAEYLGGEIKLSHEHHHYQWVDIATFEPKDQFKPGLGRAVQHYLLTKRNYIKKG